MIAKQTQLQRLRNTAVWPLAPNFHYYPIGQIGSVFEAEAVVFVFFFFL